MAPSHPGSPPADSVISILTNRKGVEYHVTREELLAFQQLYPNVSVEKELRGMAAWSMSNQDKRKTVRGMPAFMNRWLSREQNRSDGSERRQVPMSSKLIELGKRMKEAEHGEG